MVETIKPTESQKAFFDPQTMASLETAFVRSRVKENFIIAGKHEVDMHREQYGLITEVAERAVRFLNSRQIYHYYKEISKDGRLNFDANKAKTAYWAMMNKTNNNISVPLNETVNLLGIIYSTSVENKDLIQAVKAKQLAYLYKNINDWVSFEYYLASYYQYLKTAANNPQDYIIK
jgi:hypothetical protein